MGGLGCELARVKPRKDTPPQEQNLCEHKGLDAERCFLVFLMMWDEGVSCFATGCWTTTLLGVGDDAPLPLPLLLVGGWCAALSVGRPGQPSSSGGVLVVVGLRSA
jgi:hypothetical protein